MTEFFPCQFFNIYTWWSPSTTEESDLFYGSELKVATSLCLYICQNLFVCRWIIFVPLQYSHTMKNDQWSCLFGTWKGSNHGSSSHWVGGGKMPVFTIQPTTNQTIDQPFAWQWLPGHRLEDWKQGEVAGRFLVSSFFTTKRKKRKLDPTGPEGELLPVWALKTLKLLQYGGWGFTTVSQVNTQHQQRNG